MKICHFYQAAVKTTVAAIVVYVIVAPLWVGRSFARKTTFDLEHPPLQESTYTCV